MVYNTGYIYIEKEAIASFFLFYIYISLQDLKCLVFAHLEAL